MTPRQRGENTEDGPALQFDVPTVLLVATVMVLVALPHLGNLGGPLFGE